MNLSAVTTQPAARNFRLSDDCAFLWRKSASTRQRFDRLWWAQDESPGLALYFRPRPPYEALYLVQAWRCAGCGAAFFVSELEQLRHSPCCD